MIFLQWDLVCDREQLTNFVQSCTMFGVLIGNLIFSIMADKYVILRYLSIHIHLYIYIHTHILYIHTYTYVCIYNFLRYKWLQFYKIHTLFAFFNYLYQHIYLHRIGRKKPLMIAIALQSVTGFTSAFAPWYELFLILKFICALATGGTMLISFVLRKLSEIKLHLTAVYEN